MCNCPTILLPHCQYLGISSILTFFKSSPQILVSLCGLVLRTVYLEAGVYCRCIHGGSVMWRPGGNYIHTWHEEKDIPLCPSYPHCSSQHLTGCGAIWNPCWPLHAWGWYKRFFFFMWLKLTTQENKMLCALQTTKHRRHLLWAGAH